MGLKQQDHITDVVKRAIAQGIADPGELRSSGPVRADGQRLHAWRRRRNFTIVSYAGVTDVAGTIGPSVPPDDAQDSALIQNKKLLACNGPAA